MIWLLVPVLTFLYMVGGQWEKGARRFGVPGTSIIIALLKDIKLKKLKDKLKILSLCLLIPFLCIGYGENSWFKKHLKKEWLVRLAYAFMLSTPFLIQINTYFICLALLVLAYQIRAGKITTIGSFDILIEDICRGLALSISIVLLIGG